jgi:hypothetical protein
MQRVYEVKVTSVEGYYGRKILAPNIGKVVELLNEEDKEALVDTAIVSIKIDLVQL